MLDAVGTALIALIEREIIKNQSEIEAMVVEQLRNLGQVIKEYIESTLTESKVEQEDGSYPHHVSSHLGDTDD